MKISTASAGWNRSSITMAPRNGWPPGRSRYREHWRRIFPRSRRSQGLLQTGRISIILDGDQQIQERAFLADSAFFQIFSFPWLKGDPGTALDAPYSVVLTESVAEKVFGQDEALGKVLRFGDDNDYKVTGIIADVPENSHITFGSSDICRHDRSGQEIRSLFLLGEQLGSGVCALGAASDRARSSTKRSGSA